MLSLHWEELDIYVFSPVAIPCSHQGVGPGLLKHDINCSRLAKILSFWDLVNLFTQIPLSLLRLENLLTQSLNVCPHRDPHLSQSGPFCQMVRLKSCELHVALYKADFRFPPTSVSGVESTTQHC